MVKVCETDFPLGSFSGQRSAGFHMDGILKANIDVLAKKIVKDMQFVGIGCSSTFGVRTGKSTLFQQIGKYFTSKVNELHGLDNTFTIKNIVFNAEELQEKAFKLPLYSVLILDEGDDLTASHWSNISKNLKRFFRKCGQLNLFILLILPDYFEIPKTYAISRTNFLIDIKFEGEFERGFFEFYSFNKKKLLYIKGKKYNDYKVVKPSFYGQFPKLYTVNEKEYRKIKYLDMIKSDEEKKPEIIEKDIIARCFYKFYEYFKGKISMKEMANAFGICEQTASRYIKRERASIEAIRASDTPQPTDTSNILAHNNNFEAEGGKEPQIEQSSRPLESIKAQGI